MADHNAAGRMTPPGRFLARFDEIYGAIEWGFNLFAAATIFALMIFTVCEVVAHKLLRTSIFGFLDIVELSMAVFAFLGAAYCQRLGGHIRMDLLVSHLRGRTKFVVEAIAILISLLVVLVLVKATWEHAMRALEGNDTTMDADLQTWPSKILAPIGLGMLALRLALQLVGYCRLALYPTAPPVAVVPAAHIMPVAD
jgi:TRAP-type C4-dicarboxylate transport system permease small subunit